MTSTAGLDTALCDQEPIHIPAAIQPHGALVVVARDSGRILQASENAAGFLGLDASDLTRRSLGECLGDAVAQTIVDTVSHKKLSDAGPVSVVMKDRRLDAIAHSLDDATIVEFEAAVDAPRVDERHLLRRALEIQSADSITALGERLVAQVKRLTGFERVMLYRFDEDGHGYVAAEAKEPELDAYLGIHYPASDIPRQARELYTRNWLRLIPDAAYEPIPVLPATRPDTGGPLDLTHSFLRSVSPVHRQYLRNMGVRASMSISLVVRGHLWGLISCTNHSAPRLLKHDLRSTCEIIGRLASLEFEALAERQAASARDARRSTEDALVEAMRGAESETDLLVALTSRPEQLLELVSASGAAAVTRDGCVVCGDCPPPAFVRAVSDWLDEHGESSVFATSSLPALYSPAGAHKAVASGLLSLALPGVPGRRLLWFRQERIRTVNWGGDPEKAVRVDASGGGPHPRTSFELWRQEVRLRSLSWTAGDIEAATSLRRYALEIDLGRQVARHQHAVRARDEIMAIVSHDLRSPLSVMDMQARILLETVGNDDVPLRTTATRIQRSVARMNSLINNLLDLASIEAGGFSLSLSDVDAEELLQETLMTLKPLADARDQTVEHEVLGAPRVRADRERVFQVLANLFSNAVKFTDPGGKIAIRVERQGDEVRFTVADNGIGIAPDDVAHIFDRYWRVKSEGVGIGLFVVKGIISAHGGTIEVASEPGEGTTFSFTLPAAENSIATG